jgi:hypothetical protein
MTVDWDNFDKKLEDVKYPHVLIFKFFNSIHLLNDNIASIMLRFIIKNNIDIFINLPFYLIAKHLPKKKYSNTINIIESFYDLLLNRTKNFNGIKKWYATYKNVSFWNKDIDEQIVLLNNLRNEIKGIFDNAKGGVPFPIKMIHIFKSNINNSKEIVIESAIERLVQVVKLLGPDIFNSLKIPLLTISNFLELNDDTKIKYTNLVYIKITECLNIIINIFEDFNMCNLKLHNLINPVFINIEESCIDEIEDLTDYFT